ncbi:MAG: hypothetical protein AABY27_03270 [Pseudomonadota bacterium]
MNNILHEILTNLPSNYTAETEAELVSKIIFAKLADFNADVADLLAFAISERYNKLAKAILEKDYQGKYLDLQNINQSIINQSQEKYSLLHFTAQFGNEEMFLYFLEHGIKITSDKDNLSPIHVLAFAKNLNKKAYLNIIEKINLIDPELINQKDNSGLTALHYAAHEDNGLLMSVLLEMGAKR